MTCGRSRNHDPGCREGQGPLPQRQERAHDIRGALVSRARTQWRTLTPLAQDLLRDLRATLGQHPPTTTWTPARCRQGLALLEALDTAWLQERIDLDALNDLDHLTAQLNLTATVTCRAALEGLHSLYRRVAEVTYEELTPGEPPPTVRGTPPGTTT